MKAAGWQTDSKPEEYGAYLVTVSGINGPRVEIATFGKMLFDDRRRRPRWYQHDPEWGDAEIKILAWQPLPDPYGAEGPEASADAWNRRAADVGKWELLPVIGIDKETAAYINRCRCSKCEQVYKLADVAGLQMKHCPNCGQKKRDL